MNKKVKDLVMVMTSNLLNLIIATAVGFLVPEILDIEIYAEYKIFTFYIAYVTLIHFGANDGLIIKVLDKSKKELEGNNYFSSMFWIQAMSNIIFFVIMIILSKLFLDNRIYIYIILMVLPGSLNSFFTSVTNSNMEFKFQVSINFVDKFVKLLSVILIYYNSDSYMPLVISTIGVTYLILLIRVFYYRKAVFQKFDLKIGIKIYFKTMLVGMPMLFSYFVGMLAMGLDRIFIENNNSLEEYAYYAFATSMILLVAQIITTSGTVIRPYISRMGEDMRKKSYEIISNFMNIITGVSALGLIIFPYFITLVIPKMENTIIIFYYLYPIVVFRIQYSMKQRQYFFIFKRTYENLFANVALLCLVFVFNLIVLTNNYSYEYYAFASLISFGIWNLGVEIYFNRLIKVKILKSIVFSIILSLSIIYLALDFENTTRIIYFTLIILSSILLLYSSFIKNIIIMIIKKDVNLIKDL